MPDTGGESLISARVEVVADTSKADAALLKMQAKLIAAAEKASAAATKALDKQIASLERDAIAAEKNADRKAAAREREAAAAEKAANRAAAAAEKAAEREAAAFARADTKAQARVRSALARGDAYEQERAVEGMLPPRSDKARGRAPGSRGGTGDDLSPADKKKIEDDAKDKARQRSFRIMQAGRIFDDAQYISARTGIQSIGNNLIEMSPAIGMATIAIDALVKSTIGWEKLLSPGHTKTEAERMEELAKATDKVADAEARRRKMAKDQAARESQATSQTEVEEQQAKAVGEAIAKADDSKVVKGLIEANSAGFIATDAGAKKASEDFEKEKLDAYKNIVLGNKPGKYTGQEMMGFAEKNPVVQKRKDILQDNLDRAARELMGKAQNDPAALARLTRIVVSNPGKFPAELAAKLKAGDPAAFKRAQEEAQQAKDDKRQDDEDQMLRDADQKVTDERNQRRERIAGEMAASDVKRFGSGMIGAGKLPTQAEIDRRSAKPGAIAQEELRAANRGGRLNRKFGAAPMRADELGLTKEEHRDLIMKQMKAQGLTDEHGNKLSGEDMEAIAKKRFEAIEKEVAAKVNAYMAEHKVTREVAEKGVQKDLKLQNAEDAKKTQAGQLAAIMKPQMHSIQGYFDKLTMASKADDKTVLAINEGNKILGKIEEAVKKRAVSRYGNRQS
jgi:hypothetical protein